MAKREKERPVRPAGTDAGGGRDRGREGGADAPAETPPNAALEWVKSLLVAAVIFLVLRTFIVQTFVITSGSMENTLLVGDFLVVNRAAIGSRVPFTGLRVPGYSEARRGEVIVFDPPHEVDMKLVKRLIGMPGDTLEMRAQTLYVNGQPANEPYVKYLSLEDARDAEEHPDAPHPWMAWQLQHLAPGVDPGAYRPTRDNWGPLVIPEDRYFMLGDNREASLDSRYWGLLEGWRLEGRVVFIYYSYDRDSFRPFRFIREARWRRIGDVVR